MPSSAVPSRMWMPAQGRDQRALVGLDRRHREKHSYVHCNSCFAGAGILAYLPQYSVGEGERCRQPRRLDAEQMHQPAHAVLARPLNAEIGCRLARSRGLRPDAGVAWPQRAVGKRGPVAPDRGVEALGTTRVDVVADALNPFDVGAEAGLAGEVERQVHAEAAWLG